MNRLRTVLAFAPLIFIAHVAEEAPGFVAWFNTKVALGITSESFWQVNLFALVITIVVALIARFDDTTFSAIVSVAWFSLLMAANALVHIGGALIDRRYVPGLVTAVIAYLPFFGLVLILARKHGVSAGLLVVASLIGALPMLVHGYRILFLGTRLF